MFIVVYDDEGSLEVVYGADPDCEGAICPVDGPAIAFNTRKAARAAIDISVAFAKLQKAQGKEHVSDFIEFRKYVKIRKVEVRE